MSAGHPHESPEGHVLVLDAGSASLRLTLFTADGDRVADQHGSEPPGPAAAAELRNFLSEVPTPAAVGHRIVHSGPHLTGHTLIDARVRALLADVADLAPLHVTPALQVVDAARVLLPDVPHVACFDTVFHKDLPPQAHTYAVPERWRTEYGLRRYGFHGLSYTWALQRTSQALGRPVDNLQVVLVHLGGGCSACAVRNGRSVDTTMGLTPLEGLVMSRRSGSLDPGALLWLQRQHGLSTDELDDTLHRHSGLLGLSGTSGDTRIWCAPARRVMLRPRWRWRRSHSAAAGVSPQWPPPWTGWTRWSSPGRSAKTNRRYARRSARPWLFSVYEAGCSSPNWRI